MDNNERFSRMEEVLADVLVEVHGMNARIDALQQGQQQMIGTFNRFAEAVIAKMDAQTARMDTHAAKMDAQTTELKGMREDIKLLYNHEERLQKVEAIVFQKGT
jgi:hypothetical protein